MKLLFRLLLRTVLVLALLAAGVVGLLWYTFSGGPVSSDQLKVRIEAQLSSILGPNLQAKMDSTSLSVGSGGLLSLEGSGLTVLGDDGVNFGVADRVRVKVRGWPLLRGEIIADTLSVDKASIAVAPFLPGSETAETDFALDWTGEVDLKRSMTSVGQAIGTLASTIADAGLETVRFDDVQLVGFDQLGLRMRHARLQQLILAQDGNNANALVVTGQLVSDHNMVFLNGNWKTVKGGGRALELSLTGLDMQDVLVNPEAASSQYLQMDSPLTLNLSASFDANGGPRPAFIALSVGAGNFVLGDAIKTSLSKAQLNLSLLPDKNQIELEPSPIRFEKTKAVLQGGLRFADGPETKPLFELLANDVVAFSMKRETEGALGALQISGSIDRKMKHIIAETLLLKTASGDMVGDGLLDFSQEKARLRLGLGVERMDIVHFKQFWPAIVATGAHEWADDGIHGGTVRGAKLAMQLPVEDLWNDRQLTADQLDANIPIEGARVKTTGALPPISSAVGEVVVSGMVTSIQLSDGRLDSGRTGSAKVDTGSLILRAGVDGSLPADLALKLSGNAAAIAQLGRLRPLDFTDRLGLIPADLSGSVSAGITTSFDVLKDFDPTKSRWAASVQIKNGSSKSTFAERSISSADLVIEASPAAATIKGTATIDGVPAELSLVEPLSGGGSRQRVITLTLNDVARKRMGIDTGEILSGTVGVSLSAGEGGSQVIEADLTSARLELPWIGWTKGKRIAGNAKFEMKQPGKRTVLDNFSLKGRGFSARGSIVFDARGLVEAKFKNVVLNRNDDFDVTVRRTKNGYAVAMNARSYDGRAVIQKFLDNQPTNPKSGKTIAITGQIGRLMGFNNNTLSGVSLDFVQSGSRVQRAEVKALAKGRAPTSFTLLPVKGGMQTGIYSENAGAVLGFLDLYGKVRGGRLQAKLVRDKSQVFRGTVEADNFTLLDEPRIASLLRPPASPGNTDRLRGEVSKLPAFRNNSARVENLRADVEKGPGFLNIARGRMQGGDASAAFEGTVYDKRNRMNIKGTFLPGRGLNKLVSNIPLLGLAFGSGKTTGLLGITFRLRGPYGNPQITVNPLSIIAPGVFRRLFQF